MFFILCFLEFNTRTKTYLGLGVGKRTRKYKNRFKKYKHSSIKSSSTLFHWSFHFVFREFETMHHVVESKRFLKRQIMNRELEGCDAARKELFDLLKGTIETGRSNSVVISGCPGSGKSMMVQNVLEEIDKSYTNQYHTIRLHGLFHANDNLVFQDLSRQIEAELEFCDDDIVSSDIFPTLFRKLENLCKKDGQNVKTAVFILKDFHRFQGSHVLYFMFETIRSVQVPVFVIGITTNFNVLELFEKREHSRFSQIILNLNQSRTLKKRISSFIRLLTLKENSCSDPSYIESWNENIKKLVLDNGVKDLLKEMCDQSNDERFFTNFLLNSIIQLDEENPYLTKKHLSTAVTYLIPDYKINLFNSLSTVQLCLMIAAYHQSELYNEPFNFEMIYTRYCKFAKTAKAIPSVPRQMAYRDFETLVDFDLISPFSSTATIESDLPEFIFHRLSISCDDFKEGIKMYPNMLGDIKQWSDNSLS